MPHDFPASEVRLWIFFLKVNLFCCCCFVLGFFLSFVLLRMKMLYNLIMGKLEKHGLNIKRSCQFYEYVSPPSSLLAFLVEVKITRKMDILKGFNFLLVYKTNPTVETLFCCHCIFVCFSFLSESC